MTTLFRILLDFVFTAQKKRKRAKGWRNFWYYNSVCIFIDFYLYESQATDSFLFFGNGWMVFQLCSFSAFLFHGLLIMSFYYFCFALPKLRTSDYHNPIDCLMCYEWALKITNSTVPTFLKSIISIKSDFYVLSLYKNYYYQIMPTVTNFPQVNNQAQAWVLCSLELKMLVTPRPGLYDTDAYSIF